MNQTIKVYVIQNDHPLLKNGKATHYTVSSGENGVTINAWRGVENDSEHLDTAVVDWQSIIELSRMLGGSARSRES